MWGAGRAGTHQEVLVVQQCGWELHKRRLSSSGRPHPPQAALARHDNLVMLSWAGRSVLCSPQYLNQQQRAPFQDVQEQCTASCKVRNNIHHFENGVSDQACRLATPVRGQHTDPKQHLVQCISSVCMVLNLRPALAAGDGHLALCTLHCLHSHRSSKLCQSKAASYLPCTFTYNDSRPFFVSNLASANKNTLCPQAEGLKYLVGLLQLNP